MSTTPRLKTNAALLEALDALPDEQRGEVIDGGLYVMARPSAAHQRVQSRLSARLDSGGPGDGDWIILPEVSVRFGTSEEVVPDVSGWRRARVINALAENPPRVRPDWVCEILSDSTRKKDLGPKRRLCARQDVPYLWLIDPETHVFEAFTLLSGRWTLLGSWSDDEVAVGVEPFPELTFELTRWWL